MWLHGLLVYLAYLEAGFATGQLQGYDERLRSVDIPSGWSDRKEFSEHSRYKDDMEFADDSNGLTDDRMVADNESYEDEAKVVPTTPKTQRQQPLKQIQKQPPKPETLEQPPPPHIPPKSVQEYPPPQPPYYLPPHQPPYLIPTPAPQVHNYPPQPPQGQYCPACPYCPPCQYCQSCPGALNGQYPPPYSPPYPPPYPPPYQNPAPWPSNCWYPVNGAQNPSQLPIGSQYTYLPPQPPSPPRPPPPPRGPPFLVPQTQGPPCPLTNVTYPGDSALCIPQGYYPGGHYSGNGFLYPGNPNYNPGYPGYPGYPQYPQGPTYENPAVPNQPQVPPQTLAPVPSRMAYNLYSRGTAHKNTEKAENFTKRGSGRLGGNLRQKVCILTPGSEICDGDRHIKKKWKRVSDRLK